MAFFTILRSVGPGRVMAISIMYACRFFIASLKSSYGVGRSPFFVPGILLYRTRYKRSLFNFCFKYKLLSSFVLLC